MPQVVDLETLVCGGGGGDCRIACETVLAGNFETDQNNQDPPTPGNNNPPDYNFPADSYYLSKEHELEWIDRNAFFYRKDSGNKRTSANNVPISHSTSTRSNSQRFSLGLKSKASIIGLPKPQNSCFLVDSKLRRNVKNARFFPKRSGSSSSGKSSTVRVTEPSSPKVSCIGRVRSKKASSRRSLSRRRRSKGTLATATETAEAIVKPRRPGFWSSFKEALTLGCRKNLAVEIKEERPAGSSPVKTSSTEKRKPAADVEPPGLAGMNRFASGRRSDAWAGDVANLEDDDESDLSNRGFRCGAVGH